jgi:hypothetical protein
MPAATISSSNVAYTTASIPWTVNWNSPFTASAPYSLSISRKDMVTLTTTVIYSQAISTPTSGTVSDTGLVLGRNYEYTITATAYYASIGESLTDIETTSITTLANVKYWDGSNWVSKSMKVWTEVTPGNFDWVEKPVKVWNGSSWV